MKRDIYRATCVKEFEIVLEQSGKLLRKRLGAYFASNRQADRLAFKDLCEHVVLVEREERDVVGERCNMPFSEAVLINPPGSSRTREDLSVRRYVHRQCRLPVRTCN